MGILIQILIQIGCVYTEANWIQIQTTMDCDPDLNLDSGPGARVNSLMIVEIYLMASELIAFHSEGLRRSNLHVVMLSEGWQLA